MDSRRNDGIQLGSQQQVAMSTKVSTKVSTRAATRAATSERAFGVERPADGPKRIVIPMPRPFGALEVCFKASVVAGIRFLGRGQDSPIPADCRNAPNPDSASDSRLAPIVNGLTAYFRGEPIDPAEMPVELPEGTTFQRAVYAVCRRIPAGETRTYGQLASEAGSPKAARAVGNCMRTNPIPIVIPCHRVVGAGDELIGYSAPGGIDLKSRLLDLERQAWNGLPANSPPPRFLATRVVTAKH